MPSDKNVCADGRRFIPSTNSIAHRPIVVTRIILRKEERGMPAVCSRFQSVPAGPFLSMRSTMRMFTVIIEAMNAAVTIVVTIVLYIDVGKKHVR
jgi:hypothetical protein